MLYYRNKKHSERRDNESREKITGERRTHGGGGTMGKQWGNREGGLDVDIDADGAMVGAEDVGHDPGVGYVLFEGVVDEEVVDTPSDVAFAGAGL